MRGREQRAARSVKLSGGSWPSYTQRRRIVSACAAIMLLVGVALLLIQAIAGNAFVEALASSEVNLEPLTLVWGIGTKLLVNIATLLIVYGSVVLVGAWLGGPSRAAVALRRRLAPTFREHPLAVYAAAGFLLLLALLWSPSGTTREFIGTAVLAGGVMLGVAALLRQTGQEFPAIQPAPPEPASGPTSA